MPNQTTKKSDIIVPEVLADIVDAKIAAQAKITPYAKLDTRLQGTAGDTVTVPSWNYIGDAEDFDPEKAYDTGAEVETCKLTAGTQTFTIKCAMKSVSILETSVNSGLGNPIGQAGSQLAKSIIGKVDNDLMEAMYTATNVFNAQDKISYEGIVNAVTKFEDEEDGVEKVMFIHPNQEASLLTDPQFLSADKFQAGVAVNGSIGKIAGCWIKKSKKVKEEGGVYVNPIVKLEPDSPETEYTEDELPALTIYLKNETRVDPEWFPKKQRHDITASKYYGTALTNGAKVVLAKFNKVASV